MERLLDVDQQPPYVEVYSDAPLMCASLVDTRSAMASSTPQELVYFSHGVHCTVDDVASSLGLYKVKVLSSDSQTCLFAISPEMPSRQQAEVMLHAAQQLREVLSQLQVPGGQHSLLAKVTIHAGKYAGAVVGRSAWTYDLFGEDVQLLLDMDRANSPGCIMVSDAALNLISNRSGQFTPVCKVMSNGQSVQMHAWTPEEGGSPRPLQPPQAQLQQLGASRQQQLAMQAAASGPGQRFSAEQPRLQDTETLHRSPQQFWQQQPQQQGDLLLQQQPSKFHQQQQQQQRPELFAAMGSAQAAVNSTKVHTQWHSAAVAGPSSSISAAATAGGLDDELSSSGTIQQNLKFAEPVLESAYMETQGQPLAHMDLLFILMNLAVTVCCIWTSSGDSMGQQVTNSRWQVLLSAWGQWALLPVAAVWLLASPSSYGRWREQLWVAHRLLSALHVALLVLLSALQEHGLLLAAVSGPAGAAAAATVTAAGAAVTRGALGLHKGKALALLAETLGMKVRFHVHVLVNTLTCAVVTCSTLWFYAVSSSSSDGGSSNASGGGPRELPLWDLLQHLLLGWAAPTVLTYLWELDDRLKFLEALDAQRNKATDPLPAKCKDV